MNEIIDKLPDSLKSLWELETELRSAAQSAIFMPNTEASPKPVDILTTR